MKSQKWILVKHFEGFPKQSDLQLVNEELPELKDGEILVEAEYWTVDPYMRPYSAALPVGSKMMGQQVARVIKRKHPKYSVGSRVLVSSGWCTHSVVNPDASSSPPLVLPLPDTGSLPASLGLGVLGMTGMTAYFGLLRICEPKPGETVLVNAAAGAVGNMVGQIAKLKGCHVIGYAGSDDKCKWIKEELGFDYAYNYKTSDLRTTLKEAAPNGVDCYFDNVGGEFTQIVVSEFMNDYGRIAMCGSIDMYNQTPDEMKKAPYVWFRFIQKQLKMEGFLVYRWLSEKNVFVKDVKQWIAEGKIKYREHITEGFENMPKAFFGLLRGENTGKAIIKKA